MKISTKDIPKIKPFKPIVFPAYTKYVLKNEIPIIEFGNDAYDVLKMEINFKAGRLFESHNAVARACANQLKEGTVSKNSETIAREIDFYGASMNISAGMDFARLELYSLKKHFKQLLPLIADIIKNPIFSEKELNNYKQRNIQRIQIDLAKNDVVSYRQLTEAIYGKNHPYGYNSNVKSIESINSNMLQNHFLKNYTSSTCSIILAGGTNKEIHELLDQHLGDLNFKKKKSIPEWQINPSNTKSIHITGKQKYQSSIRMGRRLFKRTHQDYAGLYVLNTLLGGFFGSRLMKNLREEKGLTYDIYSTIDMLWQDGYFMVGAEVDNDNVALTLEEIYKEFDLLKKKLISEDELNLVKNYIKGNLLNLLNGPFNSIELLRLVAVYGQDVSFFNNLVHKINNIDADTILALSNHYLNREDFFEVIVGN